MNKHAELIKRLRRNASWDAQRMCGEAADAIESLQAESAAVPENCGTSFCSCIECVRDTEPQPAIAKPLPLTPDRITLCLSQAILAVNHDGTGPSAMTLFARAIEAAHGIKEPT